MRINLISLKNIIKYKKLIKANRLKKAPLTITENSYIKRSILTSSVSIQPIKTAIYYSH